MTRKTLSARSALVLSAIAVIFLGANVAMAKAGNVRHKSTPRATNHPNRNAMNTQAQTQNGPVRVISPRDPASGQALGTPTTTPSQAVDVVDYISSSLRTPVAAPPNAQSVPQPNGFSSGQDARIDSLK